jgi:hypothetical protein
MIARITLRSLILSRNRIIALNLEESQRVRSTSLASGLTLAFVDDPQVQQRGNLRAGRRAHDSLGESTRSARRAVSNPPQVEAAVSRRNRCSMLVARSNASPGRSSWTTFRCKSSELTPARGVIGRPYSASRPGGIDDRRQRRAWATRRTYSWPPMTAKTARTRHYQVLPSPR